MYHGNANERQAENYIHMVRKEEGMKKWQLTGRELATFRSIVNSLVAELVL